MRLLSLIISILQNLQAENLRHSLRYVTEALVGSHKVAAKYKRNYCMSFKDKRGKILNCKMSCIPVNLCEFPSKELTPVAVYGFGSEPTLLLSNLKM